MATFQYATQEGGLNTLEAPDASAALSALPSDAKQDTGVRFLSSEEGQELVDQTKGKIDKLSAPPAPVTTETPTGEPKKEPEPAGGYSLDEVLSITKDLKGWEKQSDGTYLPSSLALKNIGISGTDLQADKARFDLEAARADRDAAYSKLTKFDVSRDPALRSIVSGITGSWDARIRDMERVNKSREAALYTSGLRLGSRYTGGVRGGMFGSIISEEERQGVERIADLEAQKQAAIAQAKQAYENQQWNKFVQLSNIADKKYQEQLDTVSELNKAQAAQDKKLKEEQDALLKGDQIYNAIAELGGKRSADPLTIYENLRTKGVSVTMADIDKFWDSVKPSTSSGGLYKFSNAPVGDFLARGYSADMIQAIPDDLNDGGTEAVVGGLPQSEQAWIRGVLEGTSSSGGNKLTISEARSLFSSYPEIGIMLAGKGENQILEDLQSPVPAEWFLAYLQSTGKLDVGDFEAKMNWVPGEDPHEKALTAWDTFRTKVFSSTSNSLSSLFTQLGTAQTSEDGI